MAEKYQIDENEFCNKIFEYGKDVLYSDVFRKAATETHHVHSAVLDHTINVCVVSLWLCHQLKKRDIDVSEKDVIQAALCHDLGMVGRKSKYKDKLNSWREHPKESARIAKELIPDLSPEAEEMVLCHMWPLAGSKPSSNEAMILCMADKYASMADWRIWLKKHKLAMRVREKIDRVRPSHKGESPALNESKTDGEIKIIEIE